MDSRWGEISGSDEVFATCVCVHVYICVLLEDKYGYLCFYDAIKAVFMLVSIHALLQWRRVYDSSFVETTIMSSMLR